MHHAVFEWVRDVLKCLYPVANFTWLNTDAFDLFSLNKTKMFPKDNLFHYIPIHLPEHWVCAVIIAPIDREKPKLYYLDSLSDGINIDVRNKLASICNYLFEG